MDLDNLTTFYSLFSQWRFHIPDYQRGYAWEEGQWEALTDDLATLTDDNEHFTGLLVLHENKDPKLKIKTGGVVKDVYDIVDGQQRLTTLVILLNEIRSELLSLESEDHHEIADSIVKTYLYEPGPGSLQVPKLVLDRNNHDFFIHNILGIDGTSLLGAEIQSHRNMQDAQAFFRGYFDKKREEKGVNFPDWLETFYRKIAQQMKVMVYRLRSEADAGMVFEAMNNRGKKPNQLDLVKNYLLFLASKLGPEMSAHLTAKINKTWEVIFRQLAAADRADDEETLLQMHWLTVYDYDLKHWDEAKEKSGLIKSRFSLLNYLDRYEDLYHELEEYVQSLENAVVAYCDLRSPDNRTDAFQNFENDPACRKRIIKYSQKLLRIGTMRPFQPLLMTVRMRFPKDPAKYLGTVELCERYSFRVFNVAQRRSNGKEAVLFRLANQLYTGKLTFEVMSQELRRDLLGACPDSLLKSSFSIEEAVPWYGRQGLVYFLYEYEENLFGENDPIVNWKTIHAGSKKSIEHILPQHPETSGYWVDHFDEEQREHMTHQIGNLTLVLVEHNPILGNKPFPEKKGEIGQIPVCYANADIKIERELAGLKNWTPQALAKRQKRLADWAQERWAVEAPPPIPDDLLDAQKKWAEIYGFQEEFQKIYDLATRLKLVPKASKTRMAYRSPMNFNWNALAVRTFANAVEVYVTFRSFPTYPGIPDTRIEEIFESTTYWWLQAGQTSDFIHRLEVLVSEIHEE